MSFQDWMAEKAREDALDLEDAALLPLLVETSPVREVSAAPQVRWGRLLVLVGVLVTLFGAYFLYVKVIAEQAYEPWTPPRAATPVPGSPRQAHPVEPLVTPEPGASATDFRLRRMVSPNVVAFRSFEQAEDRLFGELLNLKIGVTNVQLIPVDSDTIRSVRRTLSDVSVRLRGSDLSAEEQTAIVGLVVGKYMSRERLNVRDLIMRLERGGQVPIVRIVPGKSAEAYFSGRINYPQYLLAVQAGTVSPSP